jgi:hypothetical protein
MSFKRPAFVLSVCLCLLLALTVIGITLPQPAIGQFGIGYGARLDDFVVLGCGQAVIYFVAVAVILRARLQSRLFWLVIGGAVLLRLVALSAPPFLSNDMYRDIWDGWVQAAGINPYRYIPADQHLAFLRDAAVFPNINRANYAHTIYPPAAQMVFFICTRIIAVLHLPPVFGMKLCMVALEGVAIWAMTRLLVLAGLPPMRVLIYAWNPLPVWEFAGNGHVDAITICFIALALLAACNRKPGFGAAALAAATLTKFLPVILAPALWRRWDWKFVAVFTVLIALFYAPYLGAGKGVLGFLSGYGAQEGIDSGNGIFFLSALGLVVPLPGAAPKIYLGLLALVLMALAAPMVFGRALPAAPDAATRVICQRCLLLGSVLMAGLSPHYPWYYCWLLVPACVLPWPSTVYLVTAGFLLYLNPIHTQLFWPAFLYGPFLVLALRDAWAGQRAMTALTPRLAKGDAL